MEQIERDMLDMIVADRVKLWAYPDVAIRLGQLLGRPEVGLAEISRIVSADPALAGAVLRLANSASYRRTGSEIRQISDAVGRVGIQAVYQVAVAAGLGRQVCMPGPLQELRFLAWRWSVSSALLCQELAQRRLVEPGLAFLGGLLYAFGRSVALSALEQALELHPGLVSLPREQWLAVVESRHRELGELVGRRWSLPPLVGAVLSADRPPVDESARTRLVELCQLADRVVTTVEVGPGVTPRDLRPLPGFVSQDEVRYVTGIVERLPWAIDALLEISPQPLGAARPQRSAVAFPPSTLKGALRPVDFPVVDTKAQKRIEYRATHVGTDGLVLVGAVPMQTNSIARLELQRGDTPLSVWVRITLCEKTTRGYRIEVQPFALGRDDRVRWSEAMQR